LLLSTGGPSEVPGVRIGIFAPTNHLTPAMERTPDRRMTRLKEELRIMKQAMLALVRRRSSCSR
jgi:hypothetical protein